MPTDPSRPTVGSVGNATAEGPVPQGWEAPRVGARSRGADRTGPVDGVRPEPGRVVGSIGFGVLKPLFDVLTDGLLATTTSGIRLYANPALDELTGGDARSPRHTPDPPDFLAPASHAEYHSILARLAEETSAIHVARVTVLAPDGPVRLPLDVLPLCGADGIAAGALWVWPIGNAAAARAERLERTLRRITDHLAAAGAIRDRVPDDPFAGLSNREREILDLLLAGHRTSTIADRLSLSKHTVRNHLKSMFRKAGVHGQAELVQLAHRTWPDDS